jgi:PAS domain S-box-containing protein
MEDVIQPPTVLIVDDDRGLARLIEKAVRREGFSTAIALSGEAAIAWLNDYHADLLLLDLKLPDFHGKELIDRLETVHDHVPFIIITGQGDERVAVEMMKRGALDYLLKDVQFLEFVPMVVRRALTRLEKEKRLKSAEEGFRKEHAFANAVLAASGAIMVVSDREGVIVRTNPACERVAGYSSEELRGSNFWKLFFSFSKLEEKAARAKVLRMPLEDVPVAQESLLQAKDGKRRLISWSITTLPNDSGEGEFIIASGMDITEHRRLEQEILQVSDLEQRRIGQDLHDGLGQEITAMSFLNSTLRNSLKAKGLPEADTAERLAEMLKNAGKDVRKISHGLQPVAADPESLVTSIRNLVTGAHLANGVKCLFRAESAMAMHNHGAANHLYRIAQEAMQNALRHGKPKELVISLTRVSERVILEVRDDGRGIAPQPGKSHGIGLSTMKYRAGVMNGVLEIIQPPEGGTLVRCTVPDPQPLP